jgi:hypothetical protein
MAEGKKLDPIISEFETEEQAEEYDRWFRAKVEAAMNDTRPGIPHDEAMARIDAAIKRAAAKARANG